GRGGSGASSAGCGRSITCRGASRSGRGPPSAQGRGGGSAGGGRRGGSPPAPPSPRGGGGRGRRGGPARAGGGSGGAPAAAGRGMVELLGSRFWMGSAEGEAWADPDEHPRHEVEVAAFSIARYVVTRRLYREVTGSDPEGPRGDALPATGVSWFEAIAFCNR